MSKKILNIAKIIFIITPISAILFNFFPIYDFFTNEIVYDLPKILNISLFYLIMLLAFLIVFNHIFILSSLIILYSIYSFKNIKKNIPITIILLISGIITSFSSNVRTEFKNLEIIHIGIPFNTYKENIVGFSSVTTEFLYFNIIANILFYTVILIYIYKLFISLKKNNENKN